ncbi:MAG: mercury resistance protein [Candidatus Rokubacteria bacterium]|nr:mercury resistance protein [Candidatus Rokubacteria bacterium]
MMTKPARPNSVKGYLLLGLAVLTCPCHLPILLAVLAGTGLAGALSQYFGAIFLALSVIFVASLFLGLRVLKAADQQRP